MYEIDIQRMKKGIQKKYDLVTDTVNSIQFENRITIFIQQMRFANFENIKYSRL